MAIHPESTLVRSDELLSAAVDEGLVLFSVSRSQYFAFDEITSAIWTCLETPVTLAQLCQSLQARFDVTETQCAADVNALLEDFAARGLVTVLPPSAPLPSPLP